MSRAAAAGMAVAMVAGVLVRRSLRFGVDFRQLIDRVEQGDRQPERGRRFRSLIHRFESLRCGVNSGIVVGRLARSG